MPKVYNKHHHTAPKAAIYIGRGSVWGNPFKIGVDGNREEVLIKYEKIIASSEGFRKLVKKHLKEKDLVCYCKPAKCHGDIILSIANEED